MYTLELQYPLRKFITTKVIANNEYEEDQLEKGEAYLTKLMQVVPAYVENGRISASHFNEEHTQIIVYAKFDVVAESLEQARSYLNDYLHEIPDRDQLRIVHVRPK